MGAAALGRHCSGVLLGDPRSLRAAHESQRKLNKKVKY